MHATSDYPKTKVPGCVSLVQLRAALARSRLKLEIVNGKNIRVNGELRGCSGFITAVEPTFCCGCTTVVYFNTERSCYGPLSGRFLYRLAASTNDYSGKGPNQYCADNADALVAAVKPLFDDYFCDMPCRTYWGPEVEL